ncbi:FG-GAP repeat domain-containing protein [Streptomyces sp. NPDC048581]|uniref:FG-GAP repeat domain-containing protein n=1 Tax=Streptomyces sp. NPDC048581 TaxID=3365572 RepID=UPI003721CAF6
MLPQHPRPARLALATATAAALTGGLLTFAAVPATAADTDRTHKADFNGDGYGDIALAAPYVKLGDKGFAGYVAVLYGGAGGIDPARRTVVNQDTAGVPDTVETEDNFGSALAVADLDADGYTDLAVGAAGEDGGEGSVTILWGSANGLANGTKVADPAPAAHGEWGKLLTAGDFDGDGKTDLAVGTGSAHAYVIKGGFTADGTTGTAQRVDVPEQAYAVDAMASGDTNADGRADLVLTYRTDETTDPSGSWSKGVAYLGSASGLDTSIPRMLNGGTSLTLGDIDGDGFDEIAIGNVFTTEDDHSGSLGGRVVVIRGSEGGPVNGDAPMADLTQNSTGVPGADEARDGFGSAVSIADVNGDGYGELAIGVVFEDLGTTEDAGATIVMNGASSGVSRTGALTFTQNTSGIPGTGEATDYFGSDALLTDVNADGHADFTVTAGFEDEGVGALTTLTGSASGITTTGARTFGPGSLGQPRTYGAFGAGLTG